MYIQIIILIVALIVAIALAPKPPIPKPPALSDFDVPVAEQGRDIPWLFGEGYVRGYNVVWYGDLSTWAIKEKGGKK
ncbi:hypothetical protein ACQCR8_25495 [Ralstonia pseudosolanacearum]|uniref:hypothetical protein n=1 Tax=Ralstonia pseudosolanacearum TaxID=1310165 RepID=UPI003CE95215